MSTSQISCYQCSKLFEPCKTSRGQISKACASCRDKQKKADEKRKNRVRNYQAEAKRNIDNSWKDFCRRNTEKREKEITITQEQYTTLVNSSCFFCGYHNANEIIGIDRVDNEKGYILENCIPACKFCNRAKHIFHPIFFVEKARLIGKHRNGILSDTERDNFYCEWKEYIHKAPVPYIYMKRTTEEKRKIPFQITKEQYDELIYKPCYLCGFKNRHGNGLDRIDNSKREYTYEGVLPCCSSCNMMKAQFGKDEFLYGMSKISSHLQRLPDEWKLIPRRGFQMGAARVEEAKEDKDKQWRAKTIYKAVKAGTTADFKKKVQEQTKWTDEEFQKQTEQVFQTIQSSSFEDVEAALQKLVSDIRYVRNGRK